MGHGRWFSGLTALCLGLVGVAPDAHAASKQSGAITVAGCKSPTALLPAMVYDTCGTTVLDPVLSRLVRYDYTGRAANDLADSIKRTSTTVFTVTLKKGVHFSDGSAVSAHSFVDAWNWAAYGPHQQANASLFAPIKGFASAQAGKKTSLSGLKVVSTRRFTITTAGADATFPDRLGMLAFAPLPTSFFAKGGSTGFAAKPVGAGPWRIRSIGRTGVVLTADPAYNRVGRPKLAKVTIKYYDPSGTQAYADVRAHRIAMTNLVPAAKVRNDVYASELDGRDVSSKGTAVSALAFPSPRADSAYADVRLRRAISMALDRSKLARAVGGGASAATGWVAPAAAGYTSGACGSACAANADAARALYAAATHPSTITLTVNGDGNRADTATEICAELHQVLGATCTVNTIPTFAAYYQQISRRTLKGLFLTGWRMDYPSIENFLTPLYRTGAPANDVDYSNKAFDRQLAAAAAAGSGTAARAAYDKAEAMLATDLPTAPLWFTGTPAGYGKPVSAAQLTILGTYDLSSVTLA